MSASDHLSPMQLPMFMQAKTVRSGRLGDAGPINDQPEEERQAMMDYKDEDNEVPRRNLGGLTRSEHFDKHGIEPVEMAHYGNVPMLDDGHHRLAWALRRSPDYEMPVTWEGPDKDQGQ